MPDPGQRSWHNCDAGAYSRLRQAARHLMRRERRNHTLTPTALVNEALLRLASVPRSGEPGPGAVHLTMRRVLLDHARGHSRLKRRRQSAALDDPAEAMPADSSAEDAAALQEALESLRTMSAERAEVWEQHHLLGWSTSEIAAVRGCTQRNVQLYLRAASAFLRVCMIAGE